MTLRILLSSLLCVISLAARAHEHLAAGANSDTPGSPLLFVNDADFGADAGFVFTLDAGDPGTPYAGYYFTADLAFVALAATPDDGGPEPLHAALGSHIEVVLKSVDGPQAGQFGFWEISVPDVNSTNLTWSVPTGRSGGTNRIVVSENDGSPGSDPYGHIHGRIYSVTLPGLYRVGFQFVDTSTNGPGGGPIQAPSDAFYLYFQAGVTLAGVSQSTNGIAVTFAAPSNLPDSGDGSATIYTLESSPSLGGNADWQPAAPPITGDDHLHTLTVPMTALGSYFRLRAE
jgi:hypothetical protein